MIRLCMASLAMLVLLSAPVQAADNTALSPDQEQAVRNLIRAHLLANPEIITDAMVALRERETTKAIESVRHNLEDPALPATGAAPGPDTVVVVEVFDYACPYCKVMFPELQKLLDNHDHVRLVMMDLPVIVPEISDYAARTGLAAAKQGKAWEAHGALMGIRGRLTKGLVDETIATVDGLDLDQLAKDRDDPDLGKRISTNVETALALGIQGTPAFIIGNKVLPGRVDYDVLEAVVAGAK